MYVGYWRDICLLWHSFLISLSYPNHLMDYYYCSNSWIYPKDTPLSSQLANIDSLGCTYSWIDELADLDIKVNISAAIRLKSEECSISTHTQNVFSELLYLWVVLIFLLIFTIYTILIYLSYVNMTNIPQYLWKSSWFSNPAKNDY